MKNHKIIKLFLILTFMYGCIPTTNFPEIILHGVTSPTPTPDPNNHQEVFLSATAKPSQTSIDQTTAISSIVKPSSTFITNNPESSALATPVTTPTASPSQSFLGGGTYVPTAVDVPVDVIIDTSTN